MTPLRQRFIEDMQLHGLAKTTQRGYVYYVAQYAKFYGMSPERLDLEAVRQYQLHLLNERKLSPESVNSFITAVQFLYLVTLEMPSGKANFPRVRRRHQLPEILSRKEVERFFAHVPSLRNRAALMLCYGAGLRITEAVSVRVADIDAERGMIRVVEGKGGKDRDVMLSPRLLAVLRAYWRVARPKDYLFPTWPGTIGAGSRAGRQWRAVEWVVYARPPFGGPQQVLAYLGRYTHRVAIANERLLAVSDTHVTFQWKDYRRGAGRAKSRVMTVEAAEFVRRFLLHVLPPGFPRIRYFGLCANRKRTELLAQCRAVLANEAMVLLPTREQVRGLRDALIVPALRICAHCGAPLASNGSLPAYRWPRQPPDSS